MNLGSDAINLKLKLNEIETLISVYFKRLLLKKKKIRKRCSCVTAVDDSIYTALQSKISQEIHSTFKG